MMVNAVSRQCIHRLRRAAGFSGVVLALSGIAGCTINEPYFVTVRNDLHENVTLADCNSRDCSKFVQPTLLKPGQTTGDGLEPEGGYYPAIVFGPGHVVIGCLPFRMSKRPDFGVTVRVSQAVACGSSGGIESVKGRDWPDPRV